MKMMKKFLPLILALICILGLFVGCTSPKTPTTPDVTPSTPKVEEAPEPDEPEIEYIDMYYDDRVNINVLIGGMASTVEIKDQVVTSKVTGTDNADANVLILDEENYRFIAVGTGTAVLVVDGKEYNVRVNPAPITLAVITGHSLGSGSQGNAAQSVVCEGGQAYNTTLWIKEDSWKSGLVGSTLGYSSEDRVKAIDGITNDATGSKGAKGVNSALAYQWNKLSGEKIWVLNCAAGGSCVNEWQPESSKKYLSKTIEAMNYVSNVLKNEVAAGHYSYKTTVVINFSGANFSNVKEEFDDYQLTLWHDAMWRGLVQGATVDINGDGRVDSPRATGYVPCWTINRNVFNVDLPLTYFRAMSKDHPSVFLAAHYKYLKTDAGIARNFPNLKYTVQDGSQLPRPTKVSEVFAPDKVHLLQVAYNALGFEIAESLYDYVFKTAEITSVSIFNVTNNSAEITTDRVTMTAGEKWQLVFIPNSIAVSNLEIAVEGNLTLVGLGYVTATEKGEGKIIVKCGDEIIRTVTVTIN